VSPHNDGISSSPIQEEEQAQQNTQTEPRSRSHQQVEEKIEHDDGDRLASSGDYEGNQFEEEHIEEYVSSLPTEDDTEEIDIDVDNETTQSDDTIDIVEDPKEDSDDTIDGDSDSKRSDKSTKEPEEDSESTKKDVIAGITEGTIDENINEESYGTTEMVENIPGGSEDAIDNESNKSDDVAEEINSSDVINPDNTSNEGDDSAGNDEDFTEKAEENVQVENETFNIESSEIDDSKNGEHLIDSIPDDIDTEIINSIDATKSAEGVPKDMEESASEAVHEDGFRIPALSKTNTIESNFPEVNDAEQNENVHRRRYDQGHTHIEASGSTTDSSEVVINEDVTGSFGSIGTTNTEEETEDDEVVVMKDAKLAIGTTSIESIEDEEGLEVSVENVTVEAMPNHSDASSIVTEPNEPIDNTVIVDVQDEKLESSDTEGSIGSNMSSGEDVGDEDGIDSIDDDKESTEISKDDDGGNVDENEKESDEEEDDEDLTDKVLVDYASKAAGALIIEKTDEFKGTSNLITGDRDKYAFVPCNQEKKNLVLSLSEDILVKEIKLANYERFSSTIKDFQVKGSHTLGKWVDLGTYTANSGNGEQTFALKNPTWARYLKFKFLTHHGVEWFCTLSQIKVHGSNMVQGFHEQWESIEEEKSEEDVEGDTSNVATKSPIIDETETTDTDTNSRERGNIVDTDRKLQNSSAMPEDTPERTMEVGDSDITEKEGSVPPNAQTIPSVSSRPIPLNMFRNHATFSEIIQGEIGDEQLFSDLLALIPHTSSNLPAHIKNDLMCMAEDTEMRSVHQIGRLAMESLYSLGSRIADDIAMLVTDGADSNTITSLKMNEFSSDYYQKKFGSSISPVMNMNENNIIDESSSNKIESIQNTLVGGGTAGLDESTDTRQNNDTHEEIRDDVPKPSLSSKKEISSMALESTSNEEMDESLDLAIIKLLKDLPSAECLVNLDFLEFKKKISASRKSANASGGSHGNRMMEPIFTKLTDEIFALQTSLSVHDQFSKMSVSCYQRVILDLALETENLRRDQDQRLRKLEEQILEPASMQMFRKLVISLVSTTLTWIFSVLMFIFRNAKDIWLPNFFRLCLSKDAYEMFRDSFQTALYYSSMANNLVLTIFHYSSQAIEILSTALKSNELANSDTYKGYLSAWSEYYDGGMTVVAAVLALLFCRIIMMFSWFRRRKNPKTVANMYPEAQLRASSMALTKKKKKSRKNKSRNGIAMNVRIVEEVSKKSSIESIPELPTNRSGVQPNVPIVEDNSIKSSKELIPELVKENMKALSSNSTEPLEESVPELQDEILCEKSSNNNTPTNRSETSFNNNIPTNRSEVQPNVPIVEDVSIKSSKESIPELVKENVKALSSNSTEPLEESIPELQDENLFETSSNNDIPTNRSEVRPTASSPSVVSLDGE